jgi:GH24 family phage-related lysozyme (muramidase)
MPTKQELIEELQRRGVEPILAPANKQEAQKPTESPSFMDELVRGFGRAGRSFVGGAAGTLGLAYDPLNYLTHGGVAQPTLYDSTMQGIDDLTGGNLQPRNDLERVVDAGAEALSGAGYLGKGTQMVAGAMSGAPAAARAGQVFGVESVPAALAAAGGGVGAEAASQASDGDALATILGGIGGGLAGGLPAIARDVGGAIKGGFFNSLDVSPEAVDALRKAGLPVNIATASGSPTVKKVVNASANLPFGGRMQQAIDDAYSVADKQLKQLGFTGDVNLEQAGETVRDGLGKWQERQLGRFKKLDDALDAVVPKSSIIEPAGLQARIGNLVNEEGLSPYQVEQNAKHLAIQEMLALNADAKKIEATKKMALLSQEDMARSKVYLDWDVSKLEDLKDVLIKEANSPTEGLSAPAKRFLQKYPDAKDFFFNKSAALPSNVANKVEVAKQISGIEKQRRSSLQMLKDIDSAQTQLEAQGRSGVTIKALKRTLDNVGNMLKDITTPNRKDGVYSRVYGEIADMIDQESLRIGGDRAYRISKARNKQYSKYINEYGDYVGEVYDKLKDTPEGFASKFLAGAKQGGSQAARMMGKLDEAERDTVRDSLINYLGKGNQGEGFSAADWFNSYKKMDEGARKAFFLGKPELYKAHENLAAAMQQVQSLGKFANTSRTAYYAPVVKVLTGTAGAAGAAGLGFVAGVSGAVKGVGLAYAAQRAAAKILTDEKMLNRVLKYMEAPPQKQGALMQSIVKGLIAGGMSEDDAQSVFVPQDDVEQPDAMQDMQQPQTQQMPTREELLQELQRRGVMPQEAPVAPDQTNIIQQPLSMQTQMPIGGFTAQNEGLRLDTYTDTTKNPTIGYGFNFNSGIAKKVWDKAGVETPYDAASKGQAAITPEEAGRLYWVNMAIAAQDAERLIPSISSMPETKQKALVDLSYQLGAPRLSEMRTFLASINENDTLGAIKALRNSKYYQQTPERAKRVMKLLLGRN